MPSPPALDVKALLAPIPGECPSGESVRYAGPYDAIEEARRADDNLNPGDWVRATKTADWTAVIAVATETLATTSKDLQIAVWLVEALVKRHGFPGLRDGLQLLWELQERFWDSLYPEIEDNDVEFRVAPLVWLNDKLPPSLRQIPVTQGTSGETYSWLRWEESRLVDNLGRRDQAAMQEALADGKITGEQFAKAVQTTPLEFYRTLFDDLNQVREECARLTQVVDDKCGQEAPSLLDLNRVITDCAELIESILRERGGLPPPPPPPGPDLTGALLNQPLPGPYRLDEPGSQPQPDGALSTPASATSAPVHTVPSQSSAVFSLQPQDRADALRRLAAVAAYFRQTEPHSPVSYLVQRAVRWAELPLEEWLQYVVHDATVLENIRETLGLKDTDASGA